MQEEQQNRFQEDLTQFRHEKDDAELVRFLLDQEESIDQKLLYYRGFTFDKESNTMLKIGDPLLNKEGLNFASRNFRRFLNKNSATANLNEKQVENLIKTFSSSVRRNMMQNMRKYEIESISVVDEIKNDITDMGFVLLTQSIGDKGRNFIHTPRKMTEIRSMTETPPEKKSAISW